MPACAALRGHRRQLERRAPPARLPRALAAQTYRDFALWVVDNGSTDESLACWSAAARPAGARSRAGPCACSQPPTWASPRGNNRALRAALADPGLRYCVLLNNDTVAEPGWLAALVAAAEAGPRCGSVASTMVFATRPDRVASAGITVHRDGLALDRGVGWSAAPLPRTRPQPVFGPSAGAALYRARAAATMSGGFDERFGSYLEDARPGLAGAPARLGAVWAPQAPACCHAVSATGGQGRPSRTTTWPATASGLIAKNMPGATLARCWPYILRYDFLALAYGAARGDTALIRAGLTRSGPAPRSPGAGPSRPAAPSRPPFRAPARARPRPARRARARQDVDALLRPPPAP